MPNDAALMPLISSANIACGAHAGDLDTIKRTVDLAIEHNVAIGAHPGYRDRENFGRTEMRLTADEVRSLIHDQVGIVTEIAAKAGAKIRHVKPHGALYNAAARDNQLAATIASAVHDVDKELLLFGLAGSCSLTAAAEAGVRPVSEVFADRTYQRNGRLTPRSDPNALIENDEESLEQVLDMVRYGRVRTVDGIVIRIDAETICIHGDGSGAVDIAVGIRRALEENGVTIAAPYD